MTITVGSTVYGGPHAQPGQQIRALVDALAAVGIPVGDYGRILANQIKDAVPHVYHDYADLAQKLTARRGAGALISADGDRREETAATAVNAWVGRGGAGGVPAWAVEFTHQGPGQQDPNVYARTDDGQIVAGVLVKPDIWSEELLGIVGGPAKDKEKGKFETACRSLLRVCASHHKRPVVFTAFGASTSTALAGTIVGSANTYVQDRAGGPWRPLG